MKRWLTAVVLFVAPAVTLPSVVAVPAQATAPSVQKPDSGQSAPPGGPNRAPQPAHPPRVPDPDRTLGAGWRSSTDRAITTSGDATGFHILVADAAQAYSWRTVATLAEPGIPTDQWIGQVCVTGSGRRAVVVYGPRTFTNRAVLMQRGGFAAVVDLTTGAVTKLAERVSLAYHNPGCGAGEKAVLSRLEMPLDSGDAHTWLGIVDTSRPSAGLRSIRTPGQVTSVLPVRDRLIGSKGGSLVEIAVSGSLTRLAHLGASPFRLVADGPDAVAFQVVRGEQTEFKRFDGRDVSSHGSAPKGEVKLRPGAGGSVFALGAKVQSSLAHRLPRSWQAFDALPDSEVSTTGALVVLRASTGREAAGRLVAEPNRGRPDRVDIAARLTSNGSRLRFTVNPKAGAAGRSHSPALGVRGAPGSSRGSASTAGATITTAADPNVPHDPDRGCAVSRNDPTIQVYQPTVAQIEWAANLAVRGMLTFQRPANWNNNGMAAYSPQGMFPPISLSGGGNVPAQIFLAILAQESNLWQASYHAVDGSAGNPLTSLGYYGLDLGSPNFNDINWGDTDCGYGAAQVTTGMSKADTGQYRVGVLWDYQKQKAVALDYATNLAAGVRILQDKWNLTRDAGLIANDGDPSYLENWWFAVWAYNTGFYPPVQQNPSMPWGVGWANNPANTDYPADRQMFLTAPLDVYDSQGNKIIDDDIGYDNAKHPNHWSYPERVIGFAYHSLIRYDYRTGSYKTTYAKAYSGSGDPTLVQPTLFTFCEPTVNTCDETLPPHPPADYPNNIPSACQRDDLRCWWHAPVTWANCWAACGTEVRRYTSVEPRPYTQPGENIHPTPVNGDGSCKVEGLPPGSLIIDDISTSVKLGASGCTPTFAKGGSFSLNFATYTQPGGQVVTPGKVDFHQIGAGFGGHFWFSHTYKEPFNPTVRVTGTWNINPTGKWTRIFVHIPDHGAHTQQPVYKIYRPGDTEATAKRRSLPTMLEANRWVDIGVFDFTGAGNPRVELKNFTKDGYGIQDIAWDAIAVQPLPAKPKHFIVALGDSYSSGEGAGGPYHLGTNQYNQDRGTDGSDWNACRRHNSTWSRVTTLPGASKTIGQLDDENDPNLDFQLLACSGAETENILTAGSVNGEGDSSTSEHGDWGQYNELTQLDRGYVDENTTLVVLSIGGNDSGFKEIMPACMDPTNDCSNDNPSYYNNKVSVTTPNSIKMVMRQILAMAPNAKVVLMGYPRLFDESNLCWSGVLIGSEREYLNDLADLLAQHTVGSAAVFDPDNTQRAIGIHVIDEFPAANRICAPFDSDPTGNQQFNGAMAELDAGELENNDGDPFDGASIESFHPNLAGYQHFAAILRQWLTIWGYNW